MGQIDQWNIIENSRQTQKDSRQNVIHDKVEPTNCGYKNA